MQKHIYTALVLVFGCFYFAEAQLGGGGLGLPCDQYYADADGDGLGDPNQPINGLYGGAKVCNANDCDDTDPTVGMLQWLLLVDADGDGAWAYPQTAESCTQPNPNAILVEYSGGLSLLQQINALPIDCDDTDATVQTPQVYYADTDGDGLGDIGSPMAFCGQPDPGYVLQAGDMCPEAAGTFNGCPDEIITVSDPIHGNAVRTTNYQIPLTVTQLQNAGWKDKVVNHAQFDGLGRGMHQIAIAASPKGRDMVTLMRYDGFGRQSKEYLPYPTITRGGGTGFGVFQFSNGIAGNVKEEDLQANFYLNQFPEDTSLDSNANIIFDPKSGKYNVIGTAQISGSTAERTFDHKDRAAEQGAPGKDWKITDLDQNTVEHSIKFQYQYNTANEVRQFDILFTNGDTEAPTLSEVGSYAINTLKKVVTKDENWVETQAHINDHTTEEFTDVFGRVVLKRTYDQGVAHDIYYIYDDFGNLTYVLPPEASLNATISQTVLDTWCYQYKYDRRNRLVEKKIPAKDVEYIVYNTLDQPVLTQDAHLRAKNQWLFTKYDAFGRVTYTGFHNENLTRSQAQLAVDSYSDVYEERILLPNNLNGTVVYYTSNSYPDEENLMEVLTVNYYDDYVWDTPVSITVDKSDQLINVSAGMTIGTDGTITKTGGDGSQWNEGFNSQHTLEADGYVEFEVDFQVTSTLWFAVGLSATNSAEDHTVTTMNHGLNLDHAFYSLVDNGQTSHLYADSDGKRRQVVSGDIVRVARIGNEIHFIVNGEVLKKKPASTTGPITVDASFQQIGASLKNLKVRSSNALLEEFASNVKGLPTGSKVRVLGTSDWITTATYYNEKGQNISTVSNNTYLQTKDNLATQYDFVGRALETLLLHEKSGNTIVTRDMFDYDHMGRLLTQQQTIDDGPVEVIANNVYDELGQMVGKKVGNTLNAPIQTVDYDYNIRGWMLGINDVDNQQDDLFSFKINYQRQEGAIQYDNLYNGNISQTIWRTKTLVNNELQADTKRGYSYEYDALNRIKRGTMRTGDALDTYTGYHLRSVAYDQNGNIKSLQRDRNSGMMDDLTYTYSGNQLQTVTDAITTLSTTSDNGFIDGNTSGNDYTYDSNGNMTIDANKGIMAITYNFLNLPENIAINSTENTGIIEYTYDATGVKLRKRVTEAGSYKETDYAGNYIYEDLNGVGKELIFFSHAEGYIEPNALVGGGTEYTYFYQYRDHLGNNRLNYKYTSGEVILNDPFDEDLDGWSSILGNASHENGRMKVEATNGGIYGAYKSISHTPGTEFTIFVNVDKNNTDRIRIFRYEDANDSWELQQGLNTITFTPTTATSFFVITKHDSSSDLGSPTTFYVDSIGMEIIGTPEIVEENNYYPFGLKHKGYNDVINGRDHTYEYNGMEIEEAFGYNMMEMDMRQYDASIARWVVQDPVIHHSLSPYNAFDNNPIYWADPSGADSTHDEQVAQWEAEWAAIDAGASPLDVWRHSNFSRKKSASTSNLPPTEGQFSNGFIHVDDFGSWEYQDGKWIGIGDSAGWDFDADKIPNLIFAYEVSSGSGPGHALVIDIETGLGYEIFHPTVNGEIVDGTDYILDPSKRASQFYTWQVFEPGTLTPYTGADLVHQGKNFWKEGGINGSMRAPVGLKLDFLHVESIYNVRWNHLDNIAKGEGYRYLDYGVCSTYACNLYDVGNRISYSIRARIILPSQSVNRFFKPTFERHIKNPFVKD